MNRFIANRAALAGAVITAAALVAVLVGPWLTPYSATDMDFTALLTPPGLAHPFGTDSFGRDVLTRVLFGARVSIAVSVSGVVAAALIGSGGGMLAALGRRMAGCAAQRLRGSAVLLSELRAGGVPDGDPRVRGAQRGDRDHADLHPAVPASGPQYRDAGEGRTLGAGGAAVRPVRASILWREILPNIASPLLVQLTTGIAFGVVIEAGLSFLGIGVQPPAPSLGVIMADGREYFDRAPWVLTMTGLAVSIALLGLNLLGDGLRELVDPRLRERSS